MSNDPLFFDQNLEGYVEAQLPVYQRQLEAAIRIDSESANPRKRLNLKRILDYMNGTLTSYGFSVTTVPNHGFPVLVASLSSYDPNAPEVLIYNHMDVQPVKRKEWTNLRTWGMKNPFDAKTKNGIVKGRGATDDKGPALCIVHALNFLKSKGYKLPNIRIVYETQEEDGSKTFPEFMREHGHLLGDPKVLVVSDTSFENRFPAVTYGLRGLVDGNLTLRDTPHTGTSLVEVLDIIGGIQEYDKFGTIIPPEGTIKVKVKNSHKEPFILHAKSVNSAVEVRDLGDSLELKLTSADKGVHSGIFGGVAVNPLTTLSYIVGRYLKEEQSGDFESSAYFEGMNALTKFCVLVEQTFNATTNRILVPGFYTGVQTLSHAEEESFRQLNEAVNFDNEVRTRGIRLTTTQDGLEQRKRAWTLPTFEVHGYATKEEDGATHRRMKISFRLVDEQSPQDIIAAYTQLARSIDGSIQVDMHGINAFRTDPNNTYVTLARDAYKRPFGTKAVLNRSGGTIGTMVTLQRAFPNLPIVLAGLSLLSDGYHEPNEQFGLMHAKRCIQTMATLFHSYAEMR